MAVGCSVLRQLPLVSRTDSSVRAQRLATVRNEASGHIAGYDWIRSAGRSKSFQGSDPARGPYVAHAWSTLSLCSKKEEKSSSFARKIDIGELQNGEK